MLEPARSKWVLGNSNWACHMSQPARLKWLMVYSLWACQSNSNWIWSCFLSLARIKLRLCSANHRPGYWSNLPCDWPSATWAYSEQDTENVSWSWASLSPSGAGPIPQHTCWTTMQLLLIFWENIQWSSSCANNWYFTLESLLLVPINGDTPSSSGYD